MDVAAEDDVDLARLEHTGEMPHLLLLVVLAGRGEPGVVEGDEPPGRRLGGGEVALDPRLQAGVGPVDVRVGVKDRPVGVAVVEREVRHPRVRIAGGLEERLLVRVRPGQLGNMGGALFTGRSVQRLVPVEEISQAVGAPL